MAIGAIAGAQQATTFRSRHRPRQRRRDGRRQEGEPRHRSHGRRLRDPRGRRKQTVTYFAAGDRGRAPELHLGLLLDVSESMGEDIGFTRTAAIKFLNTPDRRRRHHGRRLRHRGPGRRATGRPTSRGWSSASGSRRRAAMTALYDALGVYLDGASGSARPEDHAALHRRRRHAQRACGSASCSTC